MARQDRRRFGMVCAPKVVRELALGLASLGWNEPRSSTALQLRRANTDEETAGSLLDTQAQTRSPALFLPEEVVLAIFVVVVRTQPVGVVFTLASVCKSWRSFALGYGALWSLIDTGISPYGDPSHFPTDLLPPPPRLTAKLQLQLDRAQLWPLHITVRSCAPDAFAEVASILAAAQTRWKTLTVQVNKQWGVDAFFRACRGPSPLLERLAVIVSDYCAAPAAFSDTLLADGLFPCKSLRSIEFVRCAPIFKHAPGADDTSPVAVSPPLPVVKTLHLDVPPVAIRGQRWQRLLLGFPMLENLVMTVQDVSPHPLGLASHPMVRRFSLKSTAVGLTVLSHFRFPRLTCLSLGFPLLELQKWPAARTALYGFLDATPFTHLVFHWPEDDESTAHASAAFEEFCSVIFSTTDLCNLVVEFSGHSGPWLQLLQNFDSLTPTIASSLGATKLQKIEMVFKSLHPWSELPWLPVDDLVFVAEEFAQWEIVLVGEAQREAALWAAVEEPGRYFSQFSLSRWLLA